LTYAYRSYESGFEDKYDLRSIDGCLAGLGTGLLSTVALSLSPDLADLPLIGAEVIRVAFRLGVLVDEISQNLQARSGSAEAGPGDSWAYVVPDVAADEVQNEIDMYHSANVRRRHLPFPSVCSYSIDDNQKPPESSKVFISALSRTSVTVSGPPASLKRLFLISDYFRDRKSVSNFSEAFLPLSRLSLEPSTCFAGGFTPKTRTRVPDIVRNYLSMQLLTADGGGLTGLRGSLPR
jgi:hypothetical protein